jgi:hypothetical protein
MFLFGVSYAIASLSCTLGPFLAVTSTTFRNESYLSGVTVFVLYGLGMGLVVSVLTLAVALAKDGLVNKFRSLLPKMNVFAGVFLVIAGAYVAYYGYYEIQVFSGAAADDPIVGAFTSVQSSVANWVAGINPGVLAAALGLLVAGGVGGAWWSRRRKRTDQAAPSRTMSG